MRTIDRLTFASGFPQHMRIAKEALTFDDVLLQPTIPMYCPVKSTCRPG